MALLLDYAMFFVAIPKVWTFKRMTECTIQNTPITSETAPQFCSLFNESNPDEPLACFSLACTNTMDSIAPLKCRQQKCKSQPWLNNVTCAVRQECRKTEQKWKKAKLHVKVERANYFPEDFYKEFW